MASQVDSAVIQRTKDTLGKVIKKPPLTDKLLSRPPFRYLHDIISEVSACGSLSKWLVYINNCVWHVAQCIKFAKLLSKSRYWGICTVILIIAHHVYLSRKPHPSQREEVSGHATHTELSPWQKSTVTNEIHALCRLHPLSWSFNYVSRSSWVGSGHETKVDM